MANHLTKKFKEKKFVIYPESSFKVWWDYLMTL